MKRKYWISLVVLTIPIFLSFAPYYQNQIISDVLEEVGLPRYDIVYMNTNNLKFTKGQTERYKNVELIRYTKGNFFEDKVVPYWSRFYSGGELEYGVQSIHMNTIGLLQTVMYTNDHHHSNVIIFINICGYPLRLINTQNYALTTMLWAINS